MLLIRADADRIRGWGHVARTLALAEAWRDAGGEAVFLGCCESGHLVEVIRREGFAFEDLVATHPACVDVERTVDRARARRAAWVAVDGYDFDVGFFRSIRETGARVLAIDDLAGLAEYPVDLVLNQNLSAESLEYRRADDTPVLRGPRYALLRRAFATVRDRELRTLGASVERILVTLGGGAAASPTARVLDALSRVRGVERLEGRVVIGDPAGGDAALQLAVSTLGPRWEIHRAVENMETLMTWADLALSAGGGTLWELLAMGVPTLALVTAENQEASVEALSRAGAIASLGSVESRDSDRAAERIEALVGDRVRRESMRELGLAMVDGHGASRVVDVMRRLGSRESPILRAVRSDDAFLLWRWANDPTVRRNSFRSEPIPWSSHLAWLTDRLASRDARLLVLEDRGVPIGTIRLERTSAAEARISFSIDRNCRSRGWGAKILEMSKSLACRELGVETLVGEVLPDNTASIRAFQKAGFASEPAEDGRTAFCWNAGREVL